MVAECIAVKDGLLCRQHSRSQFARSWPRVALIANCLAIGSCGQGLGTTQAAGAWSAEQLSMSREYCSQSAMETDAAITEAQAATYCACAMEEASKRWTYDDFVSHEVSYTEILRQGGVLDKCSGAAEVTSAGWKTDEIVAARDRCEASGPDVADPGQDVQVANYCICAIEKASGKWSYTDFVANEYSYTKSLADDGSLAECEAFAGIRSGVTVPPSATPVPTPTATPTPVPTPTPFVDITPPLVSITSGVSGEFNADAPTNCYQFNWVTTATDIAAYYYKFDDDAYIEYAGTSTQKCFTERQNRTHTFRVYGVDTSGNQSGVQVRTWSVVNKFEVITVNGEAYAKHNSGWMITRPFTGMEGKTFSEAAEYCANVIYAGFSGWSLYGNFPWTQWRNDGFEAWATADFVSTYIWVGGGSTTTSSSGSCGRDPYRYWYFTYRDGFNIRTGDYRIGILTSKSEEFSCSYYSGPITTIYSSADFSCIRLAE